MPKWESKDGREMLISEMENRHVLNTLRYMSRFPGWRASKQMVLLKEAKKRNLPGLEAIVLSKVCSIHMEFKPCKTCIAAVRAAAEIQERPRRAKKAICKISREFFGRDFEGREG